MEKPTDLAETILVTHKGCMDGSGCALVFLKAGGKKENIRFVPAGMVERFVKEEPEIQGNRFLLFADIGFVDPKYVDILEKRGNCVVLDHHKTSLFMQGRSWCLIDAVDGGTACGCEMLRRYLEVEDEGIKFLCRVIDDHDRWKLKEPQSQDLAMLSVFLGQKIFIEWFQGRDFADGLFTKTDLDIMAVLKERRDENIANAIKHVIKREVAWGDKTAKVGYIVTSEMNTSLLMNKVLEAHPELDAAALLDFSKTQVSLRSRNGYDVSEMAKYFGGGGHNAAAGHPFPAKFKESMIEDLHDGR
jgi:oligoribonuclease NrnB/cAMP/cGMP phosphodiesterase (DHH superfamily)